MALTKATGNTASVRLKSHIDKFFKGYRPFVYNPDAEAWSEYNRMVSFFNWTKDKKKEKQANGRFREAIVAEFGTSYGVDTKATRDNALVRSEGPIDSFFKRYHQFQHNPHAEAWSEYHRMVSFFNWTTNNKKERRANRLFQEAIVAEFGASYGVDENKLDVLQRLCEKLEISPVPQSITSCKKVNPSFMSRWTKLDPGLFDKLTCANQAVKSVHVNIMDFVDCERTGRPIHKFASAGELRRYTKSQKKFFPKKEAKESSLLRYLLRRIL
ncbi:hypothetical protein E4U53_006772 [Claviceps sorghi]|nr:hypothetical protein E4U53_006772 [Claviceps sorghi]